MMGACLLQLAAVVVTFKGPGSKVSFMNSSISGTLSSFFIQFKTTEANTRIMTINNTQEWFAINIDDGYLNIVYKLNDSGRIIKNIDLHKVNTNEWFLLNITSGSTETDFNLIQSNTSTLLACTTTYKSTANSRLLGDGFSNLFRRSGLTIGGTTDQNSFKGCIGAVNLGGYQLDVLNRTKQFLHFSRVSSGITAGCPCPVNPCGNNTVYTWDQTKGSCTCKCRTGYSGDKCEKQPESDEDDLDDEWIYIAAGVAVGALVLVIFIVCCVLYMKRTSSTAFGVYNPKQQEKVQGRPHEVAFTIPTPEKLI